MISQLSGVVLKAVADSVKGAYIILDVHGVGYEVCTLPATVYQIQAVTESNVGWTLFTQPIIREDHWQLVGFLSEAERDLFTLLQQASGVGARMALALMAGLSMADICQALQHEQPDMLTVAKGIGPKLAKKMVLELKDKVAKWEHVASFSGGLSSPEYSVSGAFSADVNDVLVSLGYTPAEIASAFRSVSQQYASIKEEADLAMPDNDVLLKDMLGALAL